MRACVLTVVYFQLCIPQALAFELNGTKWLGAQTDFYVRLTGESGTGVSWNSAFLDAVFEWNALTPFNFTSRDESIDPCLADGLNSVDFKLELCGSEFQDTTLAVTFRRGAVQSVLGPANITEADIVVNQTQQFNVYDGDIPQFLIPGLDFRRVALHELGHVIGLEHENTEPSVMSSNIGNIDSLQTDDIAGVEALYGGLSNCTIQELKFGVLSDALDETDCTVQQLTGGSTDTSFVDLYRFELLSETQIELTMTSAALDSVLILADADLQFLGFDNKSSGECDSLLTQTLAPGSYFLLANTYDIPANADCSNTGAYQLSASFTSDGLGALGTNTSLLGGESSASFSAGISADNGNSYGNQFSPNDSLDINAVIAIDPLHQGQAGFLVVGAVVDGQILVLNETGQFVDLASNPGPIIKAANKTLAAVEEIVIATNLVVSTLNISNIVVDFYIAYGLASNPDELYYHQSPLNLTISP